MMTKKFRGITKGKFIIAYRTGFLCDVLLLGKCFSIARVCMAAVMLTLMGVGMMPNVMNRLEYYGEEENSQQ